LEGFQGKRGIAANEAWQRRPLPVNLCLALTILSFSLVLMFAPETSEAQVASLVVHVTDLEGNPLEGVQIQVVAIGSLERTEVGGVAIIKLRRRVRIEEEVELQVVSDRRSKDPWVIISPWERRVRVNPATYASIVLAKKSARDAMLTRSETRSTIIQPLSSEVGKPRLRSASPRPRPPQADRPIGSILIEERTSGSHVNAASGVVENCGVGVPMSKTSLTSCWRACDRAVRFFGVSETPLE